MKNELEKQKRCCFSKFDHFTLYWLLLCWNALHPQVLSFHIYKCHLCISENFYFGFVRKVWSFLVCEVKIDILGIKIMIGVQELIILQKEILPLYKDYKNMFTKDILYSKCEYLLCRDQVWVFCFYVLYVF